VKTPKTLALYAVREHNAWGQSENSPAAQYPLSGRLPDQCNEGVSIMSAIRREALLDCLRNLHQERVRCREEANGRDLGSTVTHGYLGMADGIEFAVWEIAERFGFNAEAIEEETAEAKPEKKMASSKGKENRRRKSS
jgi:hypothetical protein